MYLEAVARMRLKSPTKNSCSGANDRSSEGGGADNLQALIRQTRGSYSRSARRISAGGLVDEGMGVANAMGKGVLKKVMGRGPGKPKKESTVYIVPRRGLNRTAGTFLQASRRRRARGATPPTRWPRDVERGADQRGRGGRREERRGTARIQHTHNARGGGRARHRGAVMQESGRRPWAGARGGVGESGCRERVRLAVSGRPLVEVVGTAGAR